MCQREAKSLVSMMVKESLGKRCEFGHTEVNILPETLKRLLEVG